MTILLFFVTTLVFTPDTTTTDSLPPECRINIPDYFQPKQVNKDTLHYLYRKEKYKKGLKYTLQFLTKDSTDLELIQWMGKFSHKYAKKHTGNPEYREKNYPENPHIKYGAIQDTIGYVTRKIRKKIGPWVWGNKTRTVAGSFALSASRCALALNPNSRNMFTRYFVTLFKLKKFDKIDSLITHHKLSPPPNMPDTTNFLGKFYLGHLRYFIGHSAYMQGLHYADTLLKLYPTSPYYRSRWNDVFHYAIRTDSIIRDKYKPYIHEKVEKYLPDPLEE